MAYLHPDKLVSVDRLLTKKKARRQITQKPAKTREIQDSGNLVHNLAAHIYATRQARG